MIENRKYIIQGAIILTGLVFLIRLFILQVVDETYQVKAENNIVRKVVEYPYRGLIYDRHGKLIVYNSPVFDLMVVPRDVDEDKKHLFCEVFQIIPQEYDKKLSEAKAFSYNQPSLFLPQLSVEEFSRIQDHMDKFNGFYVEPRSVREYPYRSMANTLGYVAEISKNELDADTTRYYQQRDFIGKSGVELAYEPVLRGRRGARFKMVNVLGVVQGTFKEGRYDTLSVPGKDITTTIDSDLQTYGERLMQGKVGSVVAIEPSTGEILCIISSPSYDPNLLSGGEFSSNYSKLEQDTLKPLFNRPVMAMYPPGSMFKTVQALIALQEGVLNPKEQIYTAGPIVGDLAPIGYYNVQRAIQMSSNKYFYKVFRRIINQNEDPNTFIDSRIGLQKWHEYITAFGLGIRLTSDIPNVKAGFVPGPAYYNNLYGEGRWKFSTIYSLSIGQGEVLVTPLQMANLAATIANRGHYYPPHIVKAIDGETLPPIWTDPRYTGIDSIHFATVIDGMERVIAAGSGRRAYMPDIATCGKTSTVENPHGEDHSGFMAFAPKEDPKIAISVYVENAGWGGRAAASTASLIIEKYLRGEITRTWLEDFVLEGNFLY